MHHLEKFGAGELAFPEPEMGDRALVDVSAGAEHGDARQRLHRVCGIGKCTKTLLSNRKLLDISEHLRAAVAPFEPSLKARVAEPAQTVAAENGFGGVVELYLAEDQRERILR